MLSGLSLLGSPHTLDGEEERPDVVEGGRVLLEDVEADVAVVVDVGWKQGEVNLALGGCTGPGYLQYAQ